MPYTNNKCEIDEEGNHLKGKFVSDNVFDLSRRKIACDEFRLLRKGLNFAPTPEKIDRWQVKNDLEKFGRNID